MVIQSRMEFIKKLYNLYGSAIYPAGTTFNFLTLGARFFGLDHSDNEKIRIYRRWRCLGELLGPENK